MQADTNGKKINYEYNIKGVGKTDLLFLPLSNILKKI